MSEESKFCQTMIRRQNLQPSTPTRESTDQKYTSIATMSLWIRVLPSDWLRIKQSLESQTYRKRCKC